MLPYRNNRIAAAAIIIFFLAVVGYAYFEARNILYGPRIDIATPDAPLSVTEQLIRIKGMAENISELTVNGNPTSVTEDGAFDEALLLAVGYNKIVLSAKDKFGRSTTKTLQIIYSDIATSSASTTNNQ